MQNDSKNNQEKALVLLLKVDLLVDFSHYLHVYLVNYLCVIIAKSINKRLYFRINILMFVNAFR